VLLLPRCSTVRSESEICPSKKRQQPGQKSKNVKTVPRYLSAVSTRSESNSSLVSPRHVPKPPSTVNAKIEKEDKKRL